ncbi:hypothetical protein PLICRDRAFT_155599 [Plicaturopsis crispa FD-325 SS-3]|nr:hypothetical protein PLICRDRAFT_155599 [Plicaturopsis crispa FD-325 SS-3]
MASPLSSFSTCEISDSLIKLGIPHGGFLPDIFPLSPDASSPKLCAPAYTVQMVLASDTAAPKPPAHFVDLAPSGSIVVIAAPPTAKNAVWGGLMTAGAQARGALGVVIAGRCRDISEHRAAGFPVFARGQSTLGQSPFTRPAAVNVPIRVPTEDAFPEVTVNPGDWVVADVDGVVCVPRELEERVRELAKKGRAVDALCLEDIQKGLGVQASFKKHRGKL